MLGSRLWNGIGMYSLSRDRGSQQFYCEQGLGFINEWEKIVTPVVDFTLQLPFVKPQQLVLYGNSFGGYLAPRAAAFEHRLAALVCVDGIYDVYEGFINALPEPVRASYLEEEWETFDSSLRAAMAGNTQLRWAIEHGQWAFQVRTPRAFLERAKPMSMRDIAGQIVCPTLVCEAEDDRFFPGQPEKLADALDTRATYRVLTSADAAGDHCHVGAQDTSNRVVFDWLDDLIPSTR